VGFVVTASNPLPWAERSELPGKACYCGKHGCIETWLSGVGFEAEYQLMYFLIKLTHGWSRPNLVIRVVCVVQRG
jgi:hypothetical protein